MIMQYKSQQDPRITKNRSFLKEYVIILSIMLVFGAGMVLMFNDMLTRGFGPWLMTLCISSYTLFMGVVISLATRYIMIVSVRKPLAEIGQAARKVAEGDFTVQIPPKRRDGQKDEMEVFIEDFNKMVEELATIETLKGDFIANVSHEIKTPLAIIQSYVTVLQKKELSEDEKKNYLQTILDASKKLSELVGNVLRLNKLENQEIIQRESFSLAEQLRQCILTLDDKFEEKNLELAAELEEVVIHSDASLLEIVWNNLLTNAIKFTDPDGTITVLLRKEKEQAVVTITDSGCGMDENTCKRIFDRFYQGDTSHSSEGNGLGLSLVKRVIDLVEGEISVVSEKDKGSTFTVRIKDR